MEILLYIISLVGLLFWVFICLAFLFDLGRPDPLPPSYWDDSWGDEEEIMGNDGLPGDR